MGADLSSLTGISSNLIDNPLHVWYNLLVIKNHYSEAEMKDEREILTIEIVAQKLRREAKRSMVGALMTFIFGSIFFGLISLMVLAVSKPGSIAPTIVSSVLFSALTVYCVIILILSAIKLGKIGRGEFTVSEEVLADVKDNQLNVFRAIISGRHFDKDNFEHIFNFESGKTFIANSGEYRNTRLGASADFSMPGDVFYTVFYNDSPQKIVWFYSSKIYKYKSTNEASEF